jgi:hypothetical protein
MIKALLSVNSFPTKEIVMPETLKMKKAGKGFGRVRLAVSLAALVLMTGVAWGAPQYETPKDRRAAEVLPANLISGPNFQVQDRVMADGYMYRFIVNSDYGSFVVTGEYGLRKLLKEIQAISRLKEVSKGEALVEGVKDKSKDTAEFAGRLVTNPSDTLRSVPTGVSKLFSNVSTARRSAPNPRQDSMTQEVLKVSDAKRKMAYNLGVDVYSSNMVLKRALESLAKAQALGSLGVSAAIPYGGGTVAGLSRSSRTATEVNQLLRDEPPAGLANLNQRKLQAMGVDPGLVQNFLNHRVFTPRHQTVIVACLEKLSGVKGREAFIQYALSANDEDSANFFQNMAEILRGYHESVSPIQEIKVPGVLVARAANGTALVPFPLDYAVWSVRAERIVKNTLAGIKTGKQKPAKIELWVTGTVSPMFRQEVKADGITVVDKVDRRIALMD